MQPADARLEMLIGQITEFLQMVNCEDKKKKKERNEESLQIQIQRELNHNNQLQCVERLWTLI